MAETAASAQPPFSDALATIIARVPKKLQSPKIGIVCGSGLSGLADKMREKVLIPYEDLKGFGKSTVSGHLSALAFGLLGAGEGVPVVAMLGRVSFVSSRLLFSEAETEMRTAQEVSSL